MRKIHFLFITALILISCCKKPARQSWCGAVVCENDGICVNGACACNNGWKGVSCELRPAEGLGGDFLVRSDWQRHPPSGVDSSWSIYPDTMYVIVMSPEGLHTANGFFGYNDAASNDVTIAFGDSDFQHVNWLSFLKHDPDSIRLHIVWPNGMQVTKTGRKIPQ